MSVIGVAVSRDHLDIHCLPCGTSMRLFNDRKGHDKLVALAREKEALIGFESASGCKRPVWLWLVKEGIRVLQYPRRRIRNYGLACEHMAKSYKSDAKTIASFMQVWPDAGRELPSVNLRVLRALVEIRAQNVEYAMRLKNEDVVRNRQGLRVDMIDDMSREMQEMHERHVAEIEERMQSIIASDAILNRMAVALATMHGVGFVAAAALIAENPELGMISGRKVAALAGVAPFARDIGKKKGKRSISGGKKILRTVLYQEAMSAMKCNPPLAAFAQRLKDAGKPRKVVLIAVARKLAFIANAMIRDGTEWDPEANGKASAESESVAASYVKPVGKTKPDEV